MLFSKAMDTALIFQIQSALIMTMMHVGAYIILTKRNIKLHAKLMGTAIVWDILLILQIEIGRGAVAKAIKVPTNPLILNIHVAMALSCVLLYIIMIYSGRKILKGDRSLLKWHRIFGPLTLLLRTLVFATSFFVAS